MRCVVVAALLLWVSMAGAEEESSAALGQLPWDYAEFTERFAAGDWEGLSRFISPDSKMGFGGEQGMEGLRLVFGESSACKEAMLLALRQGCKKQLRQGEGFACVSPPQWSDNDVVYLGARAEFIYSASRGRWVVRYLICGGD